MNNPLIKNNFNKSVNDKVNGKKNTAEYIYIKKNKDGTKKELKFESKYVSTIDIPYGKYILK